MCACKLRQLRSRKAKSGFAGIANGRVAVNIKLFTAGLVPLYRGTYGTVGTVPVGTGTVGRHRRYLRYLLVPST